MTDGIGVLLCSPICNGIARLLLPPVILSQGVIHEGEFAKQGGGKNINTGSMENSVTQLH